MADVPAADLTFVNENLDLHQIKKRSITGAVAYVTRTFFLQGIGFVAFFLLSVFLTESQFGIFFVVDATVSFLVYFSDVGLGAALIQKKHNLTASDLATTFTIQQVLVVSLITIALFLSGRIGDFYNYGPESVFLFQALVVAFFLSSLKTIPSILLERELQFDKLVAPQILENLFFYGTAVYFAWAGFGIRSYTYAVLARAVVGLLAIYALKPWRPQFGFDKQVAKSLVTFGAPFQLNSILALFKDKAMIIFLGKILPAAQIGYLGWAEKWALAPIRFFADPILRVTFPAYSRLQEHKAEMKKAIEKSIFFVSLLVFPSVAGLIAISPHLVAHLPKYTKWQPALLALAFYGINTIFSSVSITLTNTLNATGKVKTTLKLMVMWTTLTWVLTPLSIYLWGYNGVAVASALTASSSLIAFYIVKRIVDIKLLPQILPPAVGSLIMFVAIYFIAGIFATSLLNTLAICGLGAIIYFAIMMLISPQRVASEFAIVRKYLIKVKI